jgi:hypothetical protein
MPRRFPPPQRAAEGPQNAENPEAFRVRGSPEQRGSFWAADRVRRGIGGWGTANSQLRTVTAGAEMTLDAIVIAFFEAVEVFHTRRYPHCDIMRV